MKKTPREQEIKAQLKIKVPSRLAITDKNATDHDFFTRFEQPPVQSKMEMLYQAMVTQRKSAHNRRPRKDSLSKIKINFKVAHQQTELDKITVVRQFKSQSAFKEEKKPHSLEMFKIKTLGAGFRRRGQSFTNLKPKPTQFKATRAIVGSSPSLNTLQKREQSQQLEIIKAYYSAKVDDKRSTAKKEQNNLAFGYQSEKLERQEKVPSREIGTQFYINREVQQMDLRRLQKSAEKRSISLNQSDFNDDGQTQINQYEVQGFGVTNNLSNYDLQSLEDPNGQKFLAKYQNQKAQCPYFQGRGYGWVTVQVIGFDQKSNKVIVCKQSEGKYLRVSRLSLRFLDENSQFWQRISSAKKLRAACMEQMKYMGFIDSLYSSSEAQLLVNQFAWDDKNIMQSWPKNKGQQIIRQCHFRYIKHFTILGRMHLNYREFEYLGLRKRQFSPSRPKQLIKPYFGYYKVAAIVESTHYCSFKNVALALQEMINKIAQQSKDDSFTSIMHQTQSKQLDIFVGQSLNKVKLFVKKLTKHVRQVLISEIIYRTRFSFGAEERPLMKVTKTNDKQKQHRYYRLFNYMFRDLVSQEYYYNSCDALSLYFLKFTQWVKDKPNPILKLRVYVNSNKDRLLNEPTREQCEQKLLSIFGLLEQSINKVSDLSSDLLYGPDRLLRVEMKQEVISRLKACLQTSFVKVNEYIESNTKFLPYLQKLDITKQLFNQDMLVQYHINLSQMQSDYKQIIYYSLNKSSILEINLQSSKQILSEGVLLNKARKLKQIEKQLHQQLNNNDEILSKINNELLIIPKEELSYISMKKYVNNTCEGLLDEIRQKYELCGRIYDLLEEFSFNYRQRQFQCYLEQVLQIAKTRHAVTVKRQQLQVIQKQLIEKLNNQREQIERGIEEAKIQVEAVTCFKGIQNYRGKYAHASKVFGSLQQYIRDLKNINYREQLLQQEASILPSLYKLSKKMRPYFDMWNSINDFSVDSSDWFELPIQQLNYTQIKDKITNIFKKEFVRLAKYFNDNKNADALMICEGGHQMVKKIEDRLWIISSFTRQGLTKKPAMMGNILAGLYGADAPKNFKNVNLRDLLAHGAQQQKQAIISTSNKAQRIWQLQKKVNTVVHEMKQLAFDIKQKQRNGIGHIEHSQLLQMQMATRQQIHTMQQIKNQSQAAEINKKINGVYNRLVTIDKTLVVVEEFQDRFDKYYKVLQIGEIALELPEAKKQMNQVTRSWTGILKVFEKDMLVWEAIDSDSHRSRLENCLKVLQEIESALKKYLAQKCAVFPRLFLLSDDALLDLVSSSLHNIHPRHLSVLFSGCSRLVYSTEKVPQIVGIEGEYQDRLLIAKPVNPSLMVWDRLRLLHEGVITAMRQVYANLGAQQPPQQIIAVTHYNLLRWTVMVEEHLREGRSLAKLCLKYHTDQVASSTPQAPTNRNLHSMHSQCCSLAQKTLLSHSCRALLTADQPLSCTSFAWTCHYRFYPSLSARILTAVLPLNYEYIGVGCMDVVCLFASPRQNVHMLVSAMREGAGVSCAGGGLGETVRSLATMTLSHCGQVKGGDGDMKGALRGVLIEPMLCVLTCETLSSQLLSILAQAAFQAHQALLAAKPPPPHAPTRWRYQHGLYNLGLYLQLPALATHPRTPALLTLGLCYRDLQLKALPWGVLVRGWLGAMGIMDQQLEEQAEGLLEHMRGREGQLHSVMRYVLDRYVDEQVQSSGTIETVDILRQAIAYSRSFKDQKTLQLPDLLVDSQLSQLCSALQSLSGNCNHPSQLALVGAVDSGKSHLLERALHHLEVPPQHIFHVVTLQQYLLLNTPTHHPNPDRNPIHSRFVIVQSPPTDTPPITPSLLHTVLIHQCRHLSPTPPAASPLLHYKPPTNTWVHILHQELKQHLHGRSLLQAQARRQVEMVVGLAGGTWGRGRVVGVVRGVVRVLGGMLKAGHQALEEKELREQKEHRDLSEMVYMVVMWAIRGWSTNNGEGVDESGELAVRLGQAVQSSLFSNSNSPKGSAAPNPYDYCYQADKKVWLQWHIIESLHRYFPTGTHSLAIPTKQACSALYFSQHLLPNCDFAYVSPNTTTPACIAYLVQHHNSNLNSSQQQDLHYQHFHYNISTPSSISTLLSHTHISMRGGSVYHPPQGASMVIQVQDVAMGGGGGGGGLGQYLAALLKYRYDGVLGRGIGSTRIVATFQHSSSNHHSDEKQGYVQQVSSHFVRVYCPQPGPQSQRTLYTHLLQSLFCDTDNPFTKDIRLLQHILVDMSLKLHYSVGMIEQHNMNMHASRLPAMYSLLTCISPRQIRTQLQMMQVWCIEARQAYPHVSAEGYRGLCHSLALDEQTMHTLLTVIDAAFTTDSNSPGLHLLQLPHIYNLQAYPQCQSTIINMLQLHHPSLIPHPQLLHEIIFSTRLFLRGGLRQAGMNLLRIAQPHSGTSTAIKVAMMVATGQWRGGVVAERGYLGDLAAVIGQWWRDRERQQGQLQSGDVCVIFRVEKEEHAPAYIETIVDLLTRRQSPHLAYSSLLHACSINTRHSHNYARLIKSLQHRLKIAVVLDSAVSKAVLSKWPQLYMVCQLHMDTTVEEGYVGVATRALGAAWLRAAEVTGQEREWLQGVVRAQAQLGGDLGGRRRWRFMQWMAKSAGTYQKHKQHYQEQLKALKEAIGRKPILIGTKHRLQRELQQLAPKLQSAQVLTQQALAATIAQHSLWQSKQQTCQLQLETVLSTRTKADHIQHQCDLQLNKVMPLLQTAEQSLSRVTRDDINQLRSFPNPPLPAVKVVQALCFVFDEDQQVKEKVGSDGVKVKDYWQYAKKFILNDQLLKRVIEFKPEYIKNLSKAKMQILKVLVRQPEFKQQRVFKASSAAGNLSVWMKAVVSTFQVMQVIDPKRRTLSIAMQQLSQQQNILQMHRDNLQVEQEQLARRRAQHQQQTRVQKQIEDKISELRVTIGKGEEFLALLDRLQVEWRRQIEVEIPQTMQLSKQTSIFQAFAIVYLCGVGYEHRQQFRSILAKEFPHYARHSLIDHHPQLFQLLLDNPDTQNPPPTDDDKEQPWRLLPIAPSRLHPITDNHYCESVLGLLDKLASGAECVVIVDETYTFQSLLCTLPRRGILDYTIIQQIDCIQHQVQAILALLSELNNPEQHPQLTPGTHKLLLTNLQHLSNTHIATIYHQLTGTALRYQAVLLIQDSYDRAIGLNIDVRNQLCLEVRRDVVGGLLYPVGRQGTCLWGRLQGWRQARRAQEQGRGLLRGILQADIMADRSALQQWINNYHSYCQQRGGTHSTPPQHTKPELELIAALADPPHWQPLMSHPEYIVALSTLLTHSHPAALPSMLPSCLSAPSPPITFLHLPADTSLARLLALLHPVTYLLLCPPSLEDYIERGENVLVCCQGRVEAYRRYGWLRGEYERCREGAEGWRAWVAVLGATVVRRSDWKWQEVDGVVEQVEKEKQIERSK